MSGRILNLEIMHFEMGVNDFYFLVTPFRTWFFIPYIVVTDLLLYIFFTI